MRSRNIIISSVIDEENDVVFYTTSKSYFPVCTQKATNDQRHQCSPSPHKTLHIPTNQVPSTNVIFTRILLLIEVRAELMLFPAAQARSVH